MPRTAVQAFLHRARDNDISLVAFNRVSERRQSSIPVAMRAWVLARRMQVIKLTVSPRPLWVTSGKTRSEYMFSELPQIADIVGAQVGWGPAGGTVTA